MTARGRVTSSTDWDPMRDDFNDSSYDAQYQDNDNSGRSMQSTPLDHKKLYITNIPAGLNEQGLRTAFEKYGQLEQVFLSRDPTKKYALIRYETAAEASIAMMKLNRTEPLNLHVNLAHAKGNDSQNTSKDRGYNKEIKDSGSFVSKNREKRPRNQEPMNDEEEQIDDSTGIDHNFHLEMEQIRLEQLRIQEEQLKCRQKMMLLQLQKRPSVNQAPTVSSSRRLLPDGRVIVQERIQEPDASFTGAGDSLKLPGLQRVGERACIVCGARADLYCARCAVTPYCSEDCQRKDWLKRHSAVCHNLMRLQSTRNARSASPAAAAVPVDDNANIPAPAPPAPLRPPRTSAAAGRDAPQRNTQITNGHKDFKASGDNQRGHPNQYNNNKARFVPAGHNTPAQRMPRGGAPARPACQIQTNDNEDEDWGGPAPTDKRTAEQKPFQKRQSGTMNSPNRKPTLEMSKNMFESKPKADTQQPKVETPQAKAGAPQPKVEMPKLQAGTPSIKPETKPNMRLPLSSVTETKVEVKSRPPQVALVPSQFLVEKLPIGESFVVSVEQPTGACASKQRGFVCLAMHAEYEGAYNELLADICQGDAAIVPTPGTTFAYFEPSDEGWYRARSLGASRCALLDGSRLADVTPQTKCRALAPKYADIPEFCCVLDGNAEIGMSLKCTILMKTAEGYKVSIDNASEDTYLGEGLITRWIPEVEWPPAAKPAAVSVQYRLKQAQVESHSTSEAKPQEVQEKKPGAAPEKTSLVTPDKKPTVPDVPRPDVLNDGRYLLLHVTSLARACVRACDEETTREFESVLQDAALYGIQNAKRLQSPPTPGDVVLCQYEGVHYRALVTRTKASENRYKVQYAEYGNEEIVPLEKLYSCPPELTLSGRPARASAVALSTTLSQLTEPAAEYLDSLKEEVELIATVPTGDKSVPSGSPVILSIAKNKENVNKKLEAMCTPEWKKLEEAGGDIIESDVILFSSITTQPLPTDRPFVLEVTDFSYLEHGTVSGYEHGIALPAQVYGPLTDKINEYCNSSLCAEPYLPMVEELCLARLEPYPQWFRGVVMQHVAGAGTATVLYIDYGNVSDAVPVAHLRKCMPEFALQPALAASAEIKDFPKKLSSEQLLRAVEFLDIDEEGRGRLPVARCHLVKEDMSYIIEVPDLIAAINM